MDLLEQGNQHYVNKNYKEARNCYEELLKSNPSFIVAYHNLGLTCHQLGDYDSAVNYLNVAIQHGYVESYLSRGAALRSMGNYQQAMSDFGQAFILNPMLGGAYSNYGNSLREFGMPDLAVPFCQIAQRLEPNEPIHRLNECVAHLMKGDLIEGWKKYDARWYYESDVSFKPNWPGPEYNGMQDITDKIVVVYCEQGFGDAIQFIRYIPLLQQRCAKVVLFCREPLVSFFKFNLPGVDVKEQNNESAEYNYHVPLMSLPGIFGTTIDTIPQQPLLSVDDTSLETWHKILGNTGKKRVGIVWSSTRAAWTTRFRNIAVEKILSLQNDNIELVNLEYDVSNTDKQLLEQNNVRTFNEHIHSFYDTAGLIKTLDLVIAVDTAVAHLAASVGVPTWVLLANYGCDWRWFMNRNDSPFYPNVRLFRQDNTNNWDFVLDNVKEQLKVLT